MPGFSKERYFKLAMGSYKRSDEQRWVAALACEGVVGNYDRGATMGLASDMGVSVDTIEDMAHAYKLYKELCELDDGEHRQFVRTARKLPTIYYSHFRALYDVRQAFKLTNGQILSLLLDIVHGEGSISSNQVEGHTRGRFGDTRGWQFYAARAVKELTETMQQPDLPNIPDTIGNVYIVSFEVNNKKQSLPVVAANPARAENIARKQIASMIDEKKAKKMKLETKTLGPAVTDSKNILHWSYDWLGDNA